MSEKVTKIPDWCERCGGAGVIQEEDDITHDPVDVPCPMCARPSDRAYVDPELRPAPPVRSKFYAGYHKCYDAAIPIIRRLREKNDALLAANESLAKDAERLAGESARWSARCGMVMGERDAAMYALRKIAKRIPKEPSHSREAMVIIAETALDKIGNVFTYCQNCGGAHPRDPVLPTCDAALAASASAKERTP